MQNYLKRATLHRLSRLYFTKSIYFIKSLNLNGNEIRCLESIQTNLNRNLKNLFLSHNAIEDLNEVNKNLKIYREHSLILLPKSPFYHHNYSTNEVYRLNKNLDHSNFDSLNDFSQRYLSIADLAHVD